MAEQLRLGLIGAGRIGRVHAANVAQRVPSARLVAVADVFGEAAHALAGDYGLDAYDDHRRLLERSDIDAVVICSSTDTHAQMIEEAAQAGKHIFCEKPIALDLARIDQALAAVERAGVKLQIGFNRRFDPGFAAARDGAGGQDRPAPHPAHHQPRPGAAADRLRQGVGRHLSRHDHPRL